MRRHKIIKTWLYTGLSLVTLMIIIGGITRITDSGLSMVEWHLVSDLFPPLNESEWTSTFEKYKQFPEYKKINTNMTLKEFKFIFFWEYIHRLLGKIIGIVFLFPFLYFLLKGWLNKKLKRQLMILLILGGIEGFLGWFMVKSGLINTPNVSHFRLAIHLLTACLIIGYIYWIILGIIKPKQVYHKIINNLTKYFSFILILQIVYGAFVAGTNAGYLISTESSIQTILGYFNPEVMQNLNITTNPYNIQLIHRIIACILVVLSITILIKSQQKFYQKSALILVGLIIIQVILGISTILTSMSSYFAITHQFVAVLVLLNTVHLIYISKTNSQ